MVDLLHLPKRKKTSTPSQLSRGPGASLEPLVTLVLAVLNHCPFHPGLELGDGLTRLAACGGTAVEVASCSGLALASHYRSTSRFLPVCRRFAYNGAGVCRGNAT
jgi:hypothetical protein